MPLRSRLIVSVIAAAIIGALISILSTGAPFLAGWGAAFVLSFIAAFCLLSAWKWAGGGSKLAWMVAMAFGLRLALGIGVSFGLIAFGYQDEKVQQSGYLYADAFTRDNDAWDLAQSGKPILSSFQQQIVSDQYGGALALSASIYRFLSPDAHRRLLVLILTAFAAALGVPFFWKAVRQRWGDAVAVPASWILVLYPESVLLGGSQLREPFLIGLACIGLWAVFAWRESSQATAWRESSQSTAWRKQRLAAALSAVAALLVMALFSWRVAVVAVGILLVCFFLEYVEDVPQRAWRIAGWAAMGVGIVAVGVVSWSWMTTASNYDAYLSFTASGWVQKIVRALGDDWKIPFATVYGLFQPVLPAILVDPAPWIWRVIGLLRAAGWYALAPVFLYAFAASWKVKPHRDRILLVGMALAGLVWIVISSSRAGGDQWDNPRYRTILLPWLALVAGWGWQYARRTKDAWLGRVAAAEVIFIAFFLAWYVSRYTGLLPQIPFVVMVAAIILLSLVVFVGPGLWGRYRTARAAGEKFDPLARARTFLALQPAGAAPVEAAPAAVVVRRPRLVNRWDALATAAFLVFAIIYFLGRLQGNYPIVILTGDAGNIASYAAAQDHPDWFTIDPALGDSNNTGVYATIHIPLIRGLERLTGDYGLALVWLLLPQVFLQLLGFYILGRVLFKNRFWAFLLAFLTAMQVINIGLGEIWGVWRDALPRTTFQALLPYLLALVIVWKDRPRRWPWLMVFAGLLVFAHPISAPAWGFAIWLSLWLLHPKAWSWKRRILVMLWLGAVFLAAITPFVLNYLSYQARSQSVDYTTIYNILLAYNPANLFNIPAAFGDFLVNMTLGLLIPVALVGFVATWILKKQDRTDVKLALLWTAGIAITSLLVPFVEQIVEQHFHILPLETELLRGIRYFVPLLLLFWLWPLVELAPRLANPQARRAAFGLGILLFTFWGATNRPDVRYMGSAVACLAKGHFVCETDRPVNDLITALRTQTQTGEGVFFFNADSSTTSQTLSVRYAALRPLVFSTRDSGILGYANRPALPAWLGVTHQVEAIQAMTDPQARLALLVPLAAGMKAHYLVIDFPVQPQNYAGMPLEVLMQNEGFTLFKLTTLTP